MTDEELQAFLNKGGDEEDEINKKVIEKANYFHLSLNYPDFLLKKFKTTIDGKTILCESLTPSQTINDLKDNEVDERDEEAKMTDTDKRLYEYIKQISPLDTLTTGKPSSGLKYKNVELPLETTNEQDKSLTVTVSVLDDIIYETSNKIVVTSLVKALEAITISIGENEK